MQACRSGGVCEGQILNSPVAVMRFTLVYDGRLPACGDGNSRKREKHAIREQLHDQLRQLWHERPQLRGYLNWYLGNPEDAQSPTPEDERGPGAPLYQGDPNKGILIPFSRGAFTFVPLATKKYDLVCELDILFLRAEPPGTLFTNTAGDLDNRLKLLFDALRIPAPNELSPTDVPSETQQPFFCLLEDDKLVTSFRVESERLLDTPEQSSQVKLVIRVTIKTRRVSWSTIDLEGD